MDPSLQMIVDEVRNDQGSGAADIFRSVLDALQRTLQDPIQFTKGDLEDFSLQLHQAKRSMAPMFNLANAILLSLEREDWKTNIQEKLLTIGKDMDNSTARIAELLNDVLSGGRIMTISYSSTVLACLSSMSGRNEMEVTVPVSLPMGEGRQMAKVLSDRGVRVEIIQDSMVFSLMEEMDCVIVGADAITPVGLVNKVGTFSMLAAANHFGVSAFGLCDWMKISPVEMLDPVVTQTTVGINLSMREQVFEQTPLDMLDGVITDRRILTPGEIRLEIDQMEVSGKWARLQ
jgi:translation initiation factor 2B subunit (eIF-2B alpha/beta/delta family)